MMQRSLLYIGIALNCLLVLTGCISKDIDYPVPAVIRLNPAFNTHHASRLWVFSMKSAVYTTNDWDADEVLKNGADLTHAKVIGKNVTRMRVRSDDGLVRVMDASYGISAYLTKKDKWIYAPATATEVLALSGLQPIYSERHIRDATEISKWYDFQDIDGQLFPPVAGNRLSYRFTMSTDRTPSSVARPCVHIIQGHVEYRVVAEVPGATIHPDLKEKIFFIEGDLSTTHQVLNANTGRCEQASHHSTSNYFYIPSLDFSFPYREYTFISNLNTVRFEQHTLTAFESRWF